MTTRQKRWRPVSHGLPTRDGAVLVCIDLMPPLVMKVWYEPAGFGWSLLPDCYIEHITHWMDVPAPPRRKKP